MALFNRSRGTTTDDFQLVQLPPETGRPQKAPRPEPEPEAESPSLDGSAESELPPSRMRGSEPLYGIVVGLELVVVAVLTLVMHGGKGAPKHPQTWLQIIGLAVSVGYFAVLLRRNRTLTTVAAFLAAIIVTLPAVPNSLRTDRTFVLAIPLAYGFILTQRQRKDTGLSVRGARKGRATTGRDDGSPPARATRSGAPSARPATSRRGRGRGPEAPAEVGPRASARYTPPKPKRGSSRRP